MWRLSLSPCLGGMAKGPCGEQFKAAFSCFIFSTAEPKGVDCLEQFKEMQSCFRQHPDVYGDGKINYGYKTCRKYGLTLESHLSWKELEDDGEEEGDDDEDDDDDDDEDDDDDDDDDEDDDDEEDDEEEEDDDDEDDEDDDFEEESEKKESSVSKSNAQFNRTRRNWSLNSSVFNMIWQPSEKDNVIAIVWL